jgi:hypothetical protein
MKRTFLKVLPFAAAVLLAASCSKDDNNSTDEIVNGGAQIETVTKTVKTLTIKGKVKQSISKVTTNPEGTALAFEGNEEFTFGQEGDDVYGTINIKDVSGNYEATVNYTDEATLLSWDGFTATLGTNSEEMSIAYDDLATAVHNAYYVIPFNVTSNGEGSYLLRHRGFLSKDAPSAQTDIVVYLRSAFIKALSAETTTLGGDPITVVADKYYVVPVGKTMGETSTTTFAGQIYNLGTEVFAFSVSSTKKVAFSSGNLQYNVTSGEWRFAEHQYDKCHTITTNGENVGDNYSSWSNKWTDLFGWVGASSNWTGAAQYGVSTSTTTNNVNGYGNVADEPLKSDWGNCIGEGWYTLSTAEWQYLLNNGSYANETRANKYGIGTVHSMLGLIILPDGYEAPSGITTAFVPGTTNTTYSDADWSKMEAAGAVFLPAAGGRRIGTSVVSVGSNGYYWTSSADGANVNWAYYVDFVSNTLNPANTGRGRFYGFSVRLVRAL